MLPPTMLAPHEELFYSPQTSPELRRMDMFNRARREEREAMIQSINPRQSMSTLSSKRNESDSFNFARLFQGLRNGLGHALVSAGTRIQSPA